MHFTTYEKDQSLVVTPVEVPKGWVRDSEGEVARFLFLKVAEIWKTDV